MTNDNVQIPLTDPVMDDMALALGHIVLDFNWLEIDTTGLLARLKHINDLERMEHTSDSFAKKLKAIKKELKARLPDEDSDAKALSIEIEKTLKEASCLNERRNAYIHGEYWPYFNQDGTLKNIMHRSHRDARKVSELISRKLNADNKRVEFLKAGGTQLEHDPDPSENEHIDERLLELNPGTLCQLACDINEMAYRMRELAARYSDRFYPPENE